MSFIGAIIMNIILVRNGVFPVTRDKYGEPLKNKPETGYDFPGTLQGEGKMAGIPVLFIRTSGCNLRCMWKTESGDINLCDTPYSSCYPDEPEEWRIEDIIDTVKTNSQFIRHIVISGGEPTTQPIALVQLARKIKQKLGFHVTLETNGTIFIPELINWIDMFSISPKLSSSDPTPSKARKLKIPVDESFFLDHKRFRRNTDVIQKYINACMDMGSYYADKPDSMQKRLKSRDFQLKFVISGPSDIDEIKRDFIDHLVFVEPEDIVLMPLGGSREFLSKTFFMTAELAIKNGWRFTPRLHIDLFDNKPGV
jgi:7-carboxy-7-deazaguanine synthase